jgi:hypothetical protein
VSEPEVVQFADGTVTLVPLTELERLQGALIGEVGQDRAEAMKTGRQAGDCLAEAGRVLLVRRSEWRIGTSDSAVLENAAQLDGRLEADQATLKALDRPHHGLSGMIQAIRDSRARNRLQSTITQTASQLRSALIHLAQTAPSQSLSEADTARQRAFDLQSQAAALTRAADVRAEAVKAYDSEIKRRRDAIGSLGFDSLLTAADLQAHGPRPIASPLVAKRGEEAYLSIPAELARNRSRTRYQGASQGLSFPLGHTGIRYRIGTFRGYPVSQETLTAIDTGTLVLTNQRIAFVGARRSLAMALDKILHVESYRDGLAIFKEGRETADFYIFSAAQLFLLYLNYLLDRRG